VTEHLFVYGTLRAKFPHPMAHQLAAAARFVGEGSVPGVLYSLGTYPGATLDPNAATRVIGDVFALPRDGSLLADLDAYEATSKEDEPYTRVRVDVRMANGQIIPCWTYELGNVPRRARRIHTGDFLLHRRAQKPRDERP
jgi:gamma-glutamylcyclotransferase (GGCT)/AIG2-like uncharacterized protein YtfP